VRRITLANETDCEGWLWAAAALLRADAPPCEVGWATKGGAADLFGQEFEVDMRGAPTKIEAETRAALGGLTPHLLLHASPDRFALGYSLLWRLREEPHLLSIASDPEVARAHAYVKEVRRDLHKMTAFVRFHATRDGNGEELFLAWFEPANHIVAAVAPFFVRRFATMRWSILTPRACAHWDGANLTLGQGVKAPPARADDYENIWSLYYSSTFNPARLNVSAMQRQMPKKYWKNMPETQAIAPLVRAAQTRVADMMTAEPHLAKPRRISSVVEGHSPARQATTPGALADLERACARCPLHAFATQTVPGEGPTDAALMMVGEQPGDQEDLAGRPFVGPAGKLLDAALERVSLDRSKIFLTNAVKHFKFEPRGKRRIHKKPNTGEIDICRWWLDEERRLVRPKLIVAMGATALRGLTGKSVTISSVRGNFMPLGDGASMLATVHPSYLLRLEDESESASSGARF
jgi:uracil-DNA glycosylase